MTTQADLTAALRSGISSAMILASPLAQRQPDAEDGVRRLSGV